MNSEALLFTLAAIGISETVYLVRKRITASAPVCPLGESCSIVLKSKYNHLFGVPNDVLGLAFYVLVAVLFALLVLGVGPLLWWSWIIRLALAGAFLMSLLFIFIQWRIIKAWCFWCLMSAFTISAMTLIELVKGIT